MPPPNCLHVDTESVIAEVRQRPLLWDASHHLYKDHDERSMVWREVFRSVKPDFDLLAPAKQREFAQAVRQRWKTARDAYTKCRVSAKASKSGPGRKSVKNKAKVKKYVHYDIMRFLDTKTTKTEDMMESNSVDNELELSPPFSVGNPLLIPIDEEDERNENARILPKREQNNFIDDFVETETDKLQFIKDTYNNGKDDNLLFFMSILPIVNKFSDYQKLLFRSEVMKAALQVGNMSGSDIGTPSQAHSSYNVFMN